MKKPTALIFGQSGGIGSAVGKIFISHGFRIIPLRRSIIDFNKSNSDAEINSLLTNAQPDIVVNAAGIMVKGWSKDHTEIMNVNVGSNWSILRHYMNPANQIKPTRIIMVGSSSYDHGRKLYPLYSASKAAVYNLWQAVGEALIDTPINIDLVNPVRTATNMVTNGKALDPALDYLSPEQVAEKIYQLVAENQPNRCINITFEDVK
jgi:2-C-methyl-D-erythritol 4-phosphate cytidylyltransferase